MVGRTCSGGCTPTARARLFHPTMPAEPLVILHAALRDRTASTVAEILDENQHCAAATVPRCHAPRKHEGRGLLRRHLHALHCPCEL